MNDASRHPGCTFASKPACSLPGAAATAAILHMTPKCQQPPLYQFTSMPIILILTQSCPLGFSIKHVLCVSTFGHAVDLQNGILYQFYCYVLLCSIYHLPVLWWFKEMARCANPVVISHTANAIFILVPLSAMMGCC